MQDYKASQDNQTEVGDYFDRNWELTANLDSLVSLIAIRS
jgi:hypothetical protein